MLFYHKSDVIHQLFACDVWKQRVGCHVKVPIWIKFILLYFPISRLDVMRIFFSILFICIHFAAVMVKLQS